MPYSSSWIALEPSAQAILLHYLFHDSFYFAQKMLLCIGDLCNSGVFHSELKHGRGGNEWFTSRVNRNLWEKKIKFTKFSGKTWAYTRMLMTTLSLPPPQVILPPMWGHFTSVKAEHYFGCFGKGVQWQICFWFLCVFKLNNLMGAFLIEQKWHTLLLITW